jgi:hypothetical protein
MLQFVVVISKASNCFFLTPPSVCHNIRISLHAHDVLSATPRMNALGVRAAQQLVHQEKGHMLPKR